MPTAAVCMSAHSCPPGLADLPRYRHALGRPWPPCPRRRLGVGIAPPRHIWRPFFDAIAAGGAGRRLDRRLARQVAAPGRHFLEYDHGASRYRPFTAGENRARAFTLCDSHDGAAQKYFDSADGEMDTVIVACWRFAGYDPRLASVEAGDTERFTASHGHVANIAVLQCISIDAPTRGRTMISNLRFRASFHSGRCRRCRNGSHRNDLSS